MAYGFNFLSLLASTAAMVVVGWLWYGPLFGKMWSALVGIPHAKTSAYKVLLSVCAAFVTSLVIASLVRVSAPHGAPGAVILALMLWCGFIASTFVNLVLFEHRSVKLTLINLGHHLCTLLIAAVIITLWP